MDLFIITGTTKGLGQALAKKVLAENHLVLSISRTKTISHKNFFHIRHDLTKITGLEKKLLKSLSSVKKISSVHLINNAAVVGPIGKISLQKSDAIQSHMQINLVAPMFLTGLIMDFYKKKKISQTYTNISSGAAYRPIAGWSLYCSAKAGLKMFTECMDLENQKESQQLIKFLDFSPGVMDTDMQATIRKQKASTFERREEFVQLKEKNLLLSPDTVAEKLYTLLSHPEAINKTHYDIKEL